MNDQTQTDDQPVDEISNIEGMTHDDVKSLQYVLEHVRGAYPDAHYRQSDFMAEDQ